MSGLTKRQSAYWLHEGHEHPDVTHGEPTPVDVRHDELMLQRDYSRHADRVRRHAYAMSREVPDRLDAGTRADAYAWPHPQSIVLR